MFKEFREFALRGNALDLAIGVIIGAAFSSVVNSLVDDMLMQGIAAIADEPDFSGLTFGLGNGVIRYGSFLTAIVNFLIVAFALFVFVKAINRLMRPRSTRDQSTPIRDCPYCKLSIPTTAIKCQGCTSEVEPLAA